jgi:hypothetical protein
MNQDDLMERAHVGEEDMLMVGNLPGGIHVVEDILLEEDIPIEEDSPGEDTLGVDTLGGKFHEVDVDVQLQWHMMQD